MPHSSGGGSHSGGSHHSSHSHSHSSGHGGSNSYIPRPVTVTKQTRGYSRYAYYNQGQIDYKYVKDKPERLPLFSLIFICIYMIPFVLAGIFLTFSSFHKIEPLDPATYNSSIMIDDRIDVMSSDDEEELRKLFTDFQTKTGITCCIITDCNDSWKPYYSNLEAYAYDLYVNNWIDEKHWLFVYTEPVNKDPNFNDWYWEGMQGDDTDDILTSNITRSFTEDVQKYLTTGTSVPNSFGKALMPLTQKVKVNKIQIDPSNFTFGCIWNSIIIFMLYFCVYTKISAYRKDKKKINKLHSTGIPVAENILEDTCEYCNGVYIHGVHLSCPHCGASIVPYDAKQRTNQN